MERRKQNGGVDEYKVIHSNLYHRGICIASEFKRQGCGKILLDYAPKKAEEYGINAVCFEGNIDFHGKR